MQLDGRMKKYWLPWLVGMPSETATAICSLLMGGLLEKFPRLKVCFAHGGGAFPYLIGRIEHGYNVRPDLCAKENPFNPRYCLLVQQTFIKCMTCRKYVKQLYMDSLVHDEQALRYLVSTVGVDKVVLGSDYPFPLGEQHPGKLVESIVDWDQQTKVCQVVFWHV